MLEVSALALVEDLDAAFCLAVGLVGLAANEAGLVSKTTVDTRASASKHGTDLARSDLMAGLSNAKRACGSSDSASI
jgi:hypothetical protein